MRAIGNSSHCCAYSQASSIFDSFSNGFMDANTFAKMEATLFAAFDSVQTPKKKTEEKDEIEQSHMKKKS